jgi:hypothetical protein
MKNTSKLTETREKEAKNYDTGTIKIINSREMEDMVINRLNSQSQSSYEKVSEKGSEKRSGKGKGENYLSDENSGSYYLGVKSQDEDFRKIPTAKFNNKEDLGRKQNSEEKAGTFLKKGKDALWISCADRYVSVEDVQLQGKKRMLVRDFLNGFNHTI